MSQKKALEVERMHRKKSIGIRILLGIAGAAVGLVIQVVGIVPLD